VTNTLLPGKIKIKTVSHLFCLFAGLDCEVEEPAAAPAGHQESSIVSNMAAQLQAGNPEDRVCGLQSLANLTRSGGVRQLVLEAGVGNKKTHPKKPKITHP
jgi:hypothetical protein